QEIEQSKKDVQKHLHEARRQERAALEKLNKITHSLNQKKQELNQSTHALKKTESQIRDTANKIDHTKTQEEIVSESAAQRLREIYECQCLSMVEMLFSVSSLQSLLDMFYFQERVAVEDRKLVDQLRAKAAALTARQNELGNKKNSLGELVSEIAKKAFQL